MRIYRNWKKAAKIYKVSDLHPSLFDSAFWCRISVAVYEKCDGESGSEVWLPTVGLLSAYKTGKLPDNAILYPSIGVHRRCAQTHACTH